jgi:perosamine synthetase
MIKIPIAKPFLDERDAAYAREVILSGWVTQGPKVAEFEKKFAAFVGANDAVAVSNCTTALHLSLLVAGIGAGDEVICPSTSFIATANAIVHAGALPVFAEVEAGTYNLDLADVRSKIGPRTKGVLLVHQMGMPADIDGFRALCDQHHLALIEDAACAAGSIYRGQHIGSHSDLVCFSFHPRKVITTGDGGMIATSRADFAQRLRLLRQHAMSVNDRVRHDASTIVFEEHLEVGYNYRLTDVQAAIGVRQLEKLPWLVSERRQIAARYHAELADVRGLQLPLEPAGCVSNYQSFCVYLERSAKLGRNELMQKLLDHGISTRSGIMTAHRQPAYVARGQMPRLPVSEDLCDNSLLLPLYVPMSPDEVTTVIAAVRGLLG